MRVRKLLGFLFFIICAALLSIVIVQDILSVISDVMTSVSVMEFIDTPDGVYESSLIVVAALDLTYSRKVGVPFANYCSCKKGKFRKTGKFLNHQ